MADCDAVPLPAACRPARAYAGGAVDLRRYSRRPRNWGEHWDDAKSDASDRVVRLDWWGDSIAVGDDASGGATANTQAQKLGWTRDSMAGIVAAALQARYGDAGSGFYPPGLAVSTGTWTNGFGYGAPRSTATAAASYTWERVRGTEVRIYYANAAITGSLRYQIDGGAFTTVTPPTGFGIDPGVVIVTGLADTDHTVRVEWVSGTVGIHGVEGRRGTTGIRVNRFAQHGLAGSHFSQIEYKRVAATITNAATSFTIAGTGGFTQYDVGKFVADTAGVSQLPGGVTVASVASATSATLSAAASGTGTRDFVLSHQPNTRPGIGALTINPNTFNPDGGQGQADLVVIALGVNDPSNLLYTEQTFRDGISTIVKPYTNLAGTTDPHWAPDFLFVVNHMGKWFDVAGRWPSIAQSIYDMAEGVQGQVFDAWEAGRRSWLYARHDLGSSSYWSGALGDNQIHPSAFGHRLVGDALVDLLAA